MRTSEYTKTLICERCGEPYAAHLESCPDCTLHLSPAAVVHTGLLHRLPTVPPLRVANGAPLAAGKAILLQALPSGDCVVVPTDRAIILGREAPSKAQPTFPLVPLDALGASKYGVSRRHCLIAPAGGQLWVTDLGSTNGTYLNAQPLQPHQPHALEDGDRLILGALHLLVFGE